MNRTNKSQSTVHKNLKFDKSDEENGIQKIFLLVYSTLNELSDKTVHKPMQ